MLPPVAIALLLAVIGCQTDIDGAKADTVPITRVYSDSQCMKRESGIDSIRDSGALADWWAPLSQRKLPARGLPQSLAKIDFERSSAFAVSMGSRPTPGYAVGLHSDRAPVEGALLVIPVIFLEPSPDAALAQVVTSPCAVFTVPADHYESIAVRDREGKELLESGH